jgi:hypothetical protein
MLLSELVVLLVVVIRVSCYSVRANRRDMRWCGMISKLNGEETPMYDAHSDSLGQGIL